MILNAYLLPLVPPLIVRAFLDALTGSAAAAWTPETLLALLAAFTLGYALIHLTSHVLEPALQSVAGALLRHNLLARVLERPGARPLPASPGEAVARFRNDVDEVGLFLCLWLDPLGQLLAFAFALAVLLRVDALLTVLVLLPPLGVVALVGHAGRRLRAYRRATQEAIGDVTGLLGELFGGGAERGPRRAARPGTLRARPRLPARRGGAPSGAARDAAPRRPPAAAPGSWPGCAAPGKRRAGARPAPRRRRAGARSCPAPASGPAGRRAATRASRSAAPGVSRTASAAATAWGTMAGSATGPSSTSRTPPGNGTSRRSRRSAATCSARRVLPTPPTPVSVTRRASPWPTRSASAAASSSRPMRTVSGAGRPAGAGPSRGPPAPAGAEAASRGPCRWPGWRARAGRARRSRATRRSAGFRIGSSPRSHRARVLGATPTSPASAAWVSPSARRRARRSSGDSSQRTAPAVARRRPAAPPSVTTAFPTDRPGPPPN